MKHAPSGWLTIGQFARRAGVATSALRYYETLGLLHATRTPGGQRRYLRADLRRVAFVRAAQVVGLSLDEVAAVLARLPARRTPTRRDWERLGAKWRPLLEQRLARLQVLRDTLGACIGCGCLSLDKCGLLNAGDAAAGRGAGPRLLEHFDE
jgi:MerR family redox-sensitive transcriptional activator SoxR